MDNKTVAMRKVHPKVDLDRMERRDPVAARILGLLEKEARDFGIKQRGRLVGGESVEAVNDAIEAYIVIQDALYGLRPNQMDHLEGICRLAAGLTTN
jgi:hypothetical protein